MTQYDYDLFVIGGGSGGVRAGRMVSSLGHRVGIAEEYRYGGTCVIRGCVPKKLMVYASKFSDQFEDCRGFGWDVGNTTFDWNYLIDAKDKELERLEGLYRKGLDNAGVDIFNSRAEFKDAHSVYLVAEDKIVTAEKIMVAVGGTPNRQSDMLGSEFCITSDEVFDLKKLPQKITISGGGYIAVEFAGIFAGLGVDTTLAYRGSEILKNFDKDLRTLLMDSLQKRGVNLRLNTEINQVDKNSDGTLRVEDKGGNHWIADQVMLATGRLPVTKGLGLELAGVEMDTRGYIKVDDYSKSNVDNIWAVGDVTNRVQLTPVAIHESMCFISTEYKGEPQKPDHELIATAVFSQPEIGTVGLSEEDAVKKYEHVEVYRAEFRPMRNTLSGRDEKMLMKLIVDGASKRVIGAHIMGDDAGEMAQLIAISMKMGATKTDFDNTMAVHPTASEELVTMYAPSYEFRHGERVE
jgi:glutathione reductase (NADPH)